ncbi:MAG: alpha/beta fold hydrolase [Acidimicrobiales bacterium]
MAALSTRTSGPTGVPRLVLVHGFTQSARCWSPIDDALAADHEVVGVDAPGHGGSSAVSASFDEAVDLLAAAGGRGTYLGYSMGGRLALAAAIAHPEVVERLVLIGASPGLADPDERATRIAADEALADHVEAVGVDAFLDEWLALPLFAGLHPAAAHLDERRRNTAAGLADSLRRCGTGAQPPQWDRLGELGARGLPVLLVVGEHDAKFRAIAEAMADGIGPTAAVAVVPGAGHTAHLEQPAAFLAAVRPFLSP